MTAQPRGPGEPAGAAVNEEPEPNPTCVCGHVEDEHEDIGTCTIDGCLCGGWEDAE